MDLAVGDENGNPSIPGFLQDIVPPIGDDRYEYDDIDLIGDEGAQRLDLILLLLLGVVIHQLHTRPGGSFLHRAGVAGPPCAFSTDLRKPHDDAAIVLSVGDTLLLGAAPEETRDDQDKDDDAYVRPDLWFGSCHY